MSWKRRKNIFLDRDLYQGPLQAAATICFYNKFDVISAGLGKKIISIIKQFEKQTGCVILAFCLMPDHIHLLIEIIEDSQNFLDLIFLFKQKVSYALRGKYPHIQLWQDRFIDHIIRDEKQLIRIAQYIINNPVKKKFVEDYRDWEYLGGSYFNWWDR